MNAWLAAVAATGVVFALYLLRPPARRRVVPSELIWERVLRGPKHDPDRLRWWLSMLLAALIASLVAVSVLEGRSEGAGAAGDRVVVVIDNSPTTGARTTDGRTRIELARAEARRLIGELAPGTRVMLADTQRQISTPAFESPDAALQQLGRVVVGHDRRVEIPLVAREADVRRRYVISDGVLIGDPPTDALLVSVLEPVENVGITAFELERVPGAPTRYQAFVELVNAGGADKATVLEVTGLGNARIRRELTVPAGGALTEILDLSAFDGGPVRAGVSAPGDALALDDAAYGFLPLRRTIRVMLVSEGNEYLVKSLSAQPRVRLSTTRPSAFSGAAAVDLYVFDRYAPRSRPRAPAILLNPDATPWLPATAGAVARPVLAGWAAEHPVLRNLSLRDLYIESARPARAAAQDDRQVLLRAPGDAALAVAHDAAARWVWLGFDLENSNFALHAAFPAFLNNAIEWLTGETAIMQARTGWVDIDLAGARVAAMDGSEPLIVRTRDDLRFLAGEPGIYTAVSADTRMRIAVNLFDRKVSELNRSRFEAVEAAAIASTGRERFVQALDGWMLMLLAAVALLTLEWVGYNRRLTV